jgi:hypothetical protein
MSSNAGPAGISSCSSLYPWIPQKLDAPSAKAKTLSGFSHLSPAPPLNPPTDVHLQGEGSNTDGVRF